MLVTIQHFALDHLRKRNEENEARNRHLDYFLNLAEEGEPHLSGHGQLEWLARLQPEMNNFRAAFEWSFVDQTDSEKSLRLTNALFSYWRVRSDSHEAHYSLDRVLNLSGAKKYPAAYAKALLYMGILKLINIDPGVAEPLLLQSVTLARTLKDSHTLAEALDFLGLASARQKKFEQARLFLEESQSLFHAANDRKGLALTTWHLGSLAELEGRRSAALEYREQALVLFQEVGDNLRQSVLLQSLGSYLVDAGEFERGRAMLRQALGLAYKLGSKLEMGHALSELSRAEKRMNNFARAAQFLPFAERLFLECGAQANLVSLKQEFERLRSHLDHSSLEAVLTQAESWTLSEAITYALEDGGLI
jgi:tetratricopeptide (TPR) repeat protein